ncbi:MAG: hypothetical protein KDA81_02665 [Planctomycetaceae bacterium]|nr:hypothetical protein [Planctomycetaceae bacterium]
MSHPSATICVIGNTHRREFRPILEVLQRIRNKHRVTAFPAINAALADPLFKDVPPDLCIVLQSTPREYHPQDVNELIGRTLFSRVICCFGPWCESDGRNHSIWPDAFRVPVRLSASVISRELDALLRDEDTLPVTSSRDEVFAHRLGRIQEWQPLSSLKHLNGAVISADRVFRMTLSTALKDLGLKSLKLPLITERRTVTPRETTRGPIHLVIHDLDPWGQTVERSLHASRTMFPEAVFWGIATMPDAGLEVEIIDEELSAVIPRLDFQHGLRWHVSQMLSNSSIQQAMPTADGR